MDVHEEASAYHGSRPRRVIADDGEVAPTPLATGHVPERPSWLCARCGDPWPCPEKRAQLLAEIRHGDRGIWTHVHLYLGTRFVEAADDLRPVPAGELYDRFMGWIRR